MTTEVQRVVQSIILPILILSSKILTIIFITIGFSIYSPLVSISGVLISIILSSVFIFDKEKLMIMEKILQSIFYKKWINC